MTQELENLLLSYLGELLHDHEGEHDFFVKNKIEEKIKAIHTVLELPYTKDSAFSSLLKSVRVSQIIP